MPARDLSDTRTLARGAVGVSFARELGRHGDRLAVVTPDHAELSYRTLAARVSETADRLGAERRLVQIAASNQLDPLVTYLAALAGGHPVLLTAPGERHRDALISTYDPDVVLRQEDDGWRLRERRRGSAHVLHPELAVLLSTSGSTGSPKLVRLSAGNLRTNAESIAEYLDIRDTDRATAALPMHYCYGLSVVNSNLLRGAALLLTNDSVVDQRFWETVRKWGGTSLHGVPYTFDLLDRVGFDRMRLPTLRYVTQAGGALAPDRVRRLAELGQRRGWRFFVMYGQTEATARMAYLPPELAASHPSVVGVPIPGGSFEIRPSDVPGQGELVYHGPNVMLGYAESAADLALGRTVDALPTGDLARQTADGLYQIVGRASRFIKLAGLRVDLRRTEQILAEHGHRAACTGDDDALVVATESPNATQVPEVVRSRLGLPASHVRVAVVDEIPRLPNGKTDYRAIRQLATRPTGREADLPLHDRFAKVLCRKDIADGDTFVTLGGDSLTYVQMSMEIERELGYLPRNWHITPVGELARRTPRPGRRLVTTTVETNILLRATAITLIVGTHIGLFTILGGAHLLLIVAGWTFARFCLAPTDTGTSRGILRCAARIAIPSMLWLIWRVADTTDVGLSNVLLIDNYVRIGARGYWFIEVLVHSLVVFAVVFAVPAIRRLEQRHGFAFALATLSVALLLNPSARDTIAFPERSMATHGVLWLFVLGWLAYRAAGIRQQAVVVAIALLTVPGYFGDPEREAIITVGLTVLMLVPRVAMPRPLVRLAAPVASASLYIYLTHYAVYHLTSPYLPAPVVLVLCLGAGVLIAVAARRVRAVPVRRVLDWAGARRQGVGRPNAAFSGAVGRSS